MTFYWMTILNYIIRVFMMLLTPGLLEKIGFSSAGGTPQNVTDIDTCGNRPPAVARVGGVIKLINEDNFERYQGSYPPGVGLEENGVSFFVLDAAKSILYVSDFLNETTSTELKDFCVSGERFTRSPIRGYDRHAGVAENNARTR